VAHEAAGPDNWKPTLWCGECAERQTILASTRQTEAFCRQHELALFRLSLEARRREHERFADEIDTFVLALRCDLIGWDDFAR
jgi:hypothetical protein